MLKEYFYIGLQGFNYFKVHYPVTNVIPMKKYFNISILIPTLLIFVIMSLLVLIPLNRLSFLDPVSQNLGDFDFYDMVYTQMREEPPPDTNIVIVNIGKLARGQIAEQLEMLIRYKPKVIGLDALFLQQKDPEIDKRLQKAITSFKNLIMVNKVEDFNPDSNRYSTLTSSIEQFRTKAAQGFANFPEKSGTFRTIREFRPTVAFEDTNLNAFALEIVKKAAPSMIEKLIERENETEDINYRGNYQKFYFIDADELQVNNNDFSFIEDKIVLLGYMGETIDDQSLEDRFFTPLNPKYSGRTLPDMYGVVIHANIISMILNENYIDKMSFPLAFFIAFIVGYLNCFFIISIRERWKDFLGTLTKLSIFLQSITYLYLSIVIFHYFNYKPDLTLSVAVVFLGGTALDFYNLYLVKLYLLIKKWLKR